MLVFDATKVIRLVRAVRCWCKMFHLSWFSKLPYATCGEDCLIVVHIKILQTCNSSVRKDLITLVTLPHVPSPTLLPYCIPALEEKDNAISWGVGAKRFKSVDLRLFWSYLTKSKFRRHVIPECQKNLITLVTCYTFHRRPYYLIAAMHSNSPRPPQIFFGKPKIILYWLRQLPVVVS